MGWRFRRSIRIAKGVHLNISKSGLGISAGVKGLRVGVGPRGPYTSAGIPGTGLYSIQYSPSGRRNGSGNEVSPPDAIAPGGCAIGCGGILAVAGIALIFGEPTTGIVTLLIGLAVVAYGLANPARRAHKLYQEANRKLAAAIAAHESGRHDEALDLADEAKRMLPEDDPAADSVKGYILTAVQRYAEAIPCLEGARQQGADQPIIPLLLATAWHGNGRSHEAIELLQSIPEDHPKHLVALILLASIFDEIGQIETAVEVLKRAPLQKRKLDEQLLAVHYSLGDYYVKLGEKKSAIRHFRRVYAHDTEYRDVRQQLEAIGGLP